jgi:hypothetical protein
MPNIIRQFKDRGLVPVLNDGDTARQKIRAGKNKWNEVQHEIPHVRIGRRKFWTDEALAAYVRRNTHQPPEPRRKPVADDRPPPAVAQVEPPPPPREAKKKAARPLKAKPNRRKPGADDRVAGA